MYTKQSQSIPKYTKWSQNIRKYNLMVTKYIYQMLESITNGHKIYPIAIKYIQWQYAK
jgi:hypothetical protein